MIGPHVHMGLIIKQEWLKLSQVDLAMPCEPRHYKRRHQHDFNPNDHHCVTIACWSGAAFELGSNPVLSWRQTPLLLQRKILFAIFNSAL